MYTLSNFFSVPHLRLLLVQPTPLPPLLGLTRVRLQPVATCPARVQAAVLGAGPIGMMTIFSALSAGCSQVLVSDLSPEKLRVAESLVPGKVKGFVAKGGEEFEEMKQELDGRLPNVVFEAAGHHAVAAGAVKLAAIGGRVVLIGCAAEPISQNVTKVPTIATHS